MTPHAAYEKFADDLISDGFPFHCEKYVTAADIMVAGILPDAEHDAINRRIMLAAHRILKITPIQFQAALGARRKELDKLLKAERAAEVEAEALARRSTAADALGGTIPTNATDVASYFVNSNISTNFQGECRVDGELIDPAKPINERIQLLAEQCGLTIG